MAANIDFSIRPQESDIPISDEMLNICNDMMEGLKKLNLPEASLVHFRHDLLTHFSRLPNRYLTNLNISVTDVVKHIRALNLAKKLPNRSDIHIGLIKVHPSTNKKTHPMDELIFASEDNPKLLHQLTNTLGGMSLDINEAYGFSTKDGYAFYVIKVTGSSFETPRKLKEAVQKEFLKAEIASQKAPHWKSFWSSWTWPEIGFFVIPSITAVYFLVMSVALRYGVNREHGFLKPAYIVGKRLISHKSTEQDESKNVSFALAFIAVPLLGTLSIIPLLIKGVYISLQLKTKVPIIFWLVIGGILGSRFPFAKMKIAAVHDKGATMYSGLVTLIATLSNFYREK